MASRKETDPVRLFVRSSPLLQACIGFIITLFSSHHRLRHRAYLLTWLGAAVRIRDGRDGR
jgi:hypothetical protein